MIRETDTQIEEILIKYYKKEIFNQGDDYYTSKNSDGTWKVGYVNDYPMQHGKGRSMKISLEKLKEILDKYGTNV